MKPSWWISTAAFLASTALSIETSPFYAPQEAEPNKRAYDVLQLLSKRVANNCPSGYNPCSTLNNSNICCKTDSHCSRDAADNIACCPTGASCTGSLVAATSATSSTSSFMFPQYTLASETTGSEGPSITGSTISGAYPFIYVPTTFSNAATCSAYYSQCQKDYSQCTQKLGNGGQYGVTVAGNDGAGVTVQGGAATATAGVCASLKLEACHGLNLGYCASSDKDSSENGASSSGRGTSLKDLCFGMAVGVAGMFI